MTNKNTCNTCTRRLLEMAYSKSLLFRFFRGPLKYIMRLWVYLLRINIRNYSLDHTLCFNCNRPYKSALKEKSKIFRWLNNRINPVFDAWIEKIVSEKEIIKAKKHADAIKNNSEIPDGWNLQNDFKKWNRI